MSSTLNSRSRGLSDRTLRVNYTFTHTGTVGAVSADKGYGTEKTTYGANVTVSRAAFTAESEPCTEFSPTLSA